MEKKDLWHSSLFICTSEDETTISVNISLIISHLQKMVCHHDR